MYDAYRTIRQKYFPKDIHIVDLFHVIRQLTRAVNKIRVKAMNNLDKGSLEYRFMKTQQKLFLCRKEDIPDRYYSEKKSFERYHYDALVHRCCLKDDALLKAYNVLQDLYHYNQKYNFKEAFDFVNYIADRLIIMDDQILIDVGNTYRK